MENINIKLGELGEGALQEQFQDVMAKVVENILDLNADPTKKRKITIEIETMSDEYREDMFITFTVKPPKLIGREGASARALIGREKGKLVANELKSGQRGQMYFDPEDSELKDDQGTPVKEIEETAKIKKFKTN